MLAPSPAPSPPPPPPTSRFLLLLSLVVVFFVILLHRITAHRVLHRYTIAVAHSLLKPGRRGGEELSIIAIFFFCFFLFFFCFFLFFFCFFVSDAVCGIISMTHHESLPCPTASSNPNVCSSPCASLRFGPVP